MAKKSKVKTIKGKSIKEVKKDLIQSYLQIKKKHKDPEYEVMKQEFLNKSNSTQHEINLVFGTYSDLRDEAEGEFRRKLPQKARALLSERKKLDKDATKEECIDDLRLVQEANFGKNITRNFYREHGKYADSTWNRHFGTFQEFRRQAGLELSRTQHRLEREVAKHASVDHYRNFFRTEVLPYYMKYEKKDNGKNIKKMIIGSDFHDEEADEFALSVFIDTCIRIQPDVIVLNGDIADCYEFSTKYKQDPRKIRIKERFDFLKYRIFKPLRDGCPDAQIDFVMGNHEFRILNMLADRTPHMRVLLADVMGIEFKDIFGLDEFQINWVSKVDLGAFTKKDQQREMKNNYQIYYGCYAVAHIPDQSLMKVYSGTNGHHHKAQLTSEVNVDKGGPITWVQTPSIHYRDAEYMGGVSKWNMGFLEVTINVEKQQATQFVHLIHDEWCEIHGVVYEREDIETDL
jgi:hypothetical protein